MQSLSRAVRAAGRISFSHRHVLSAGKWVGQEWLVEIVTLPGVVATLPFVLDNSRSSLRQQHLELASTSVLHHTVIGFTFEF